MWCKDYQSFLSDDYADEKKYEDLQIALAECNDNDQCNAVTEVCS
jgi:hypothetical protein